MRTRHCDHTERVRDTGGPVVRWGARRGAALRRCGVPLALLGLVLSACARDVRISRVELEQMEHEILAAPPVLVEPAAEQELALTDFRPYTIKVGDVLAIRMVGLGTSEADRYAPTVLQLRVHKDGTIALPIVGGVRVEGLDLADAEQALIAAHVPNIVKELSVYIEPVAPETTTVLVLGAAARPGLTPLRFNERNVLYALAAAGGFGMDGSGRVRLRPVRTDREERVYDLTDVNDVRRAMLAPPLESGDVLEVEGSDVNAVYVNGLVNAPGAVPVPPAASTTVLRAIAASGGLRDYLTVKEATLVRTLADGREVHVKLDVGEMLAGRTPDMALRPGDILRVPHTADTMFQEWFVRNVMVGPFSVGVRYDPLGQYNANRALRRDDGRLQESIRQSLGSAIPGLLIPPVTAP
mgnify:CR=1 FL=1